MKRIDFLHISTNPADWVDNQKNIRVLSVKEKATKSQAPRLVFSRTNFL